MVATLRPSQPNVTSGTLVTIVAIVTGGVPWAPPHPTYTEIWSLAPANCGVNVTLEWMNCTESAPGTYSVRLTATDSDFDSVSTTVAWNVNPKIALVIGSSSAFSCAGSVGLLTGNFTATSTGGTGNVTVVWSFGDGTTATGARVSHGFAIGQNYTIVANATDLGGGRDNASTQLVGVYSACGTTGGPTFSTPELLLEVAAFILGAVIIVLAVMLLRGRPPAAAKPRPISPADVPPGVSDPSAAGLSRGSTAGSTPPR